ncbi:MAG: Holliday junction resolvase RuvX [Sulfurospirillum sp.]|nr:MAG: Holliday junction resolvase RuvX [Sulfurospirillum sp.]
MRYASLDIGLKRIGIALSLDGKIALPQDAILRKNRVQAAKDVSLFLKEWEIDKLVVGVPLGGSSEEEMRRRIEHFVSLLEYDKEIVYQDEAGSSYEAKDLIKGVRRDKRDGKLDSIAAKIILERYLGC